MESIGKLLRAGESTNVLIELEHLISDTKNLLNETWKQVETETIGGKIKTSHLSKEANDK